MLLANNICFKRGNNNILKNINIQISEKKIVHLKGKNGVGKTTLLKIITNVLEPNEGEIYWNGKNIKNNPFEFYKNFTFIMDSKTSNNNLTVSENIFFWTKLFSSQIKKKEVSSILSVLSLYQYKDTLVRNLSYGEIKKLELSRLIVEQKKLWVLDEPYIGLDNSSTDIINQTMVNHVELGGMIIFTSHITPEINFLQPINLENE